MHQDLPTQRITDDEIRVRAVAVTNSLEGVSVGQARAILSLALEIIEGVCYVQPVPTDGCDQQDLPQPS